MLLAEVDRDEFAQFLKAQRELRGFGSWKDFARSADVGEASVYRVIEDGPDEPGTHLNTRNQIAKALGYSDWNALVAGSRQLLPPDQQARVIQAAQARGLTVDQLLELLPKPKPPKPAPEWKSAEDFLAKRKVARPGAGGHRPLPLYSGVAAFGKGLTGANPVGTVDVAAEIHGDFVVPLKGECMEPQYLDGQRVVLSRARWEKEGFRDNRDYLVVFTDGTSTFKRVQHDPADRDVVHLVPLNAAGGYKPARVHKRELRWAARWTATLEGK